MSTRAAELDRWTRPFVTDAGHVPFDLGGDATSLPRRPRPGPGRHRTDASRDEAWLRALTGPPITLAD